MPRSTLYEEDVFPGNHSSVWGSWWDRRTRAWGYGCCHSTTKNAYCLGEAGKRAAAAAREQLEANMRTLEEQKAKQDSSATAAGAGAATAAAGASGAGAGTATTTASSLFSRKGKQSLGASIGAGLFADDSGASALDVGELDEAKLRAALAAEDARKKRERREREEEEEEERKGKRKKEKKKTRSESSGSSSEDDDDDADGEDEGRGRKRRPPASDVHPSSASGLTAEELEAYRLRRERADDPMLLQQRKGGGGGGGGDGYDLV